MNNTLEQNSEGDVAQKTDSIRLRAGGRAFSCSRRALVEASPYFRAMFSSGMKESGSAEIEIHDVDAETLDTLIGVSQGRQPAVNDNNLEPLLKASTMLQFEQLTEACVKYATERLSVDNAVHVWQMGEAYSIRRLRCAALITLLWNFDKFSECPRLSDCPFPLLKWLLSRDRINVRDEASLLAVVKTWLKSHSLTDERTVEILSSVRFGLVERDMIEDLRCFVSNDSSEIKLFLDNLLRLRDTGRRAPRLPVLAPAVVVSKRGPGDEVPDNGYAIFCQRSDQTAFEFHCVLPTASSKSLEGFVVCTVGKRAILLSQERFCFPSLGNQTGACT